MAFATNTMRSGAIEHLGDEELVRLIAREFESPAARNAISELFRRYQGRVYQWCFRYARNHEQAMDLSQEVFLGAYQSLRGFGGRAGFASWLFAIARNRCVSAMRKTSPLKGASDDPDLIEDVRSGPDGEIENRQQKEALLELMRRTLEPTEQEALCLQVFEQMPVDSITEVLGIPGSTGARGVLQSARRKLRAAIAQGSDSQGESDHG